VASRLLWWIFLAGIALRIAIWPIQKPESNDKHFEYAHYVSVTGELPTPDEVEQAYQPPLYYLLAAPLASLPSPKKTVQALSLLLALLNLWLLHRLISETTLLSEAAKVHAMALAAFLPQFVLFGNVVTNDALTFPLTTACCWALLNLSRQPSNRNVAITGLLLGLGLLTKASFVPLVPILASLTWLITRRRGAVLLLLAVSLGPGSWQLARTYGRYSHALTNAQQVAELWVAQQQEESRNWLSPENLNPLRLLRKPYAHLTHDKSYPVAMYATFYFPYIFQDGLGRRLSPLPGLPQAVYLTALFPTLAMLAGFLLLARRVAPPWGGSETVTVLFTLLSLAGCAATVITAMIQFQVWSFAQGRYLFPYMFPLGILLGTGLERVRRIPALPDVAMLTFWAVSLAGLLADALMGYTRT